MPPGRFSPRSAHAALCAAPCVAVFILIGAAATVLVSWAIATSMHRQLRQNNPPRWGVRAHRTAVGRTPTRACWNGAPMSLHVTVTRDYRGPHSPQQLRTYSLATGWPLLALASRKAAFDPETGERNVEFGSIGLSREWEPLPLNYGCVIRNTPPTPIYPYLPLWSGLALDTAFYGGLAYCLWTVPEFVRRRSRRRHGLCARCGYDVHGTPGGVCPECGHASGAREAFRNEPGSDPSCRPPRHAP